MRRPGGCRATGPPALPVRRLRAHRAPLSGERGAEMSIERPEPDELETPVTEEALRRRAVQRLRKQADFRTHIVIYLATNALLVGIWWATGMAFFWPVFAILGWGIGLVAHA